MLPTIDYNRVFARIPEIMNLDLIFRRNAWEGKYYITGEPHAYKRDKLKVKLRRGIWVHEQGGESMTLVSWLVEYGGCDSYKQAFEVIRGNDMPVSDFHFTPKIQNVKYVPKSYLESMKGCPLELCPLFRWMSWLFGNDRTREEWERYNVMTDEKGNAVYFYINREGHILHDKRIRYNLDGHRDKSCGCSRRYKVGDGFSGRCFFGEHLISDDTVLNIVESEKTALIASTYFGEKKGLWIATGGKTQIKSLLPNIKDRKFRLFPDIDAVDEWAEYGDIVEWWKGREFSEHSDVGDLVVSLAEAKLSRK